VCNKPSLTDPGEILLYSGLGARWISHKSSTASATFSIALTSWIHEYSVYL